MSGPIVVTDHAFGGLDHERAVAEKFARELVVHQCRSEDEVVEALRGVEVAFVNLAPVTDEAIQAMPPGSVLIRYGIGVDNVDVQAADAHGVRVCNVPDYGADTVADHAVACLLALLRRTNQATQAIRRDGWLAAADLGQIRGFRETTVGLLGLGRIGRAVAARLRAFGFEILAHDPYIDASNAAAEGIRAVDLDELLERSHALSLHAPLTDQNRHLIGRHAISKMRTDAVIVNTSRGALVHEAELARALMEGRLGGAALDVFDPEPLAWDSPLRELDNVILTPHAAFYSESSLRALQRLASEEAERALSGRPLRCEVTRRTP
ncbi:MAG: dihydrofolate reductase [Nocardioides sp.]|nr:dihydrofolate reductase [Nocardioides sp.]|tara:strand:- start:70 stop:1038 length:969 start_codon:yes stop_codon:yes gene_type:complete